VHRFAPNLLGQNEGSDTPSISVEVEVCANTIDRRGGSRDPLKTFNDQWNSTTNPRMLRTKHQYSIEKPQEKYSTLTWDG
jgi:hypothetical protein